MNTIIESTALEKIEKEIITLKNQTAENIIQIGYKLIEAKKQLSHGEWGTWLEKRIAFSQRTANQFMRIAKEFGSNSQAISNLEITKVGLLLDVPTEKREEFIENYDLKSMSTREIKKAIKEAINEKPKCRESVVDKKLDESIYEISIKELRPIPDYEQYFGMRTGTDWIMFLNNINKYGITSPVLIARDKTIIDGHERVRACKDLGLATVKCRYICQEERYRKEYTDEQLKLYLFLISNMKSRSSDWYISQFWLDTLFDTDYGDKSGDITHYLTDEHVNTIKHNQMIMSKMYDVVRDKINGKITENEMDEKISELHKQYKKE